MAQNIQQQIEKMVAEVSALLMDENDRLEGEIDNLTKQCESFVAQVDADNTEIARLNHELALTKAALEHETTRSTKLEAIVNEQQDQISKISSQYDLFKHQIASGLESLDGAFR